VGVTPVVIKLTNSDGEEVTAFRSDDHVLVRGYEGNTDANGDLTVSLDANSTLDRANTYYTVTIGTRSFLIEKGASTEDLVDCIVGSPAALGASLRLGQLSDVNVAGVTDDQVLSYDNATSKWIPVTGGGGGGGTVDTVVGGTNITVDATDPANPIVNADDAALGGDLSGTVSNAAIASGVIVDADVSASAAIALSKLATDPLARANHTGTQAGSTVDAATDSARGTVELATTAEVQTGTDPARVPSVASMVAGGGQVLIAETVLGSGQASVGFASIPATFRHLRLVIIARTNRAAVDDRLLIAYNADTTATNYARHLLTRTNGSVFSEGVSNDRIIAVTTGASANAAAFGQNVIDLADYRSAAWKTGFASLVNMNGTGTSGTVAGIIGHQWMNTAAVTSIDLTPNLGTEFAAGSRFALYGIG
jgi:hypothetical protein